MACMSTDDHSARTPDADDPADRVRRMEGRLAAARPLLDRLETAAEDLDRATAKVEELSDYYDGVWTADREALAGTDAGDAEVLGEDEIWNEMTRYRSALADLAERTREALARWDSMG